MGVGCSNLGIIRTILANLNSVFVYLAILSRIFIRIIQIFGNRPERLVFLEKFFHRATSCCTLSDVALLSIFFILILHY